MHTYNITDEMPSVAVVMAVAEFADRSPLDLQPLEEVVDTDALDALFTDDKEADGKTAFEYLDFEITVEPDQVLVQPRAEGAYT